jgi:hypothetical protein
MKWFLALAVSVCFLVGCAGAPALAEDPPFAQRFQSFRLSTQPQKAGRISHRTALCEKIGGVGIGFSTEKVLNSCWGKPVRINETTTAAHSYEQWVYGGGYLYLTDGVVTSIQTSR